MAIIEGHGLASVSVVALGKLDRLPKLLSAEAVSSTKIRLTFDAPMTLNVALLSAASYTLVPVTSGAAALYYSEVTAEDADEPTFVEITCSEMTDSATYNAAVSTDGPVDKWGAPIDPSANSDDFTGVGVAPLLNRVEAIGANRVDVIFNEPMKDDAEIRDTTNYVFDNGLSTLSVLDVSGDTVKLVTGDQFPGLLYTLTIT